MSKESDAIEMNGVVVGINRRCATVQLMNGAVVQAMLSGKLWHYRIRVVAGDRVSVQVTPYDPTKGRVVWRDK